MARIRSVKPELFTHDGLFEAERDYKLPLRLAFIGLFTQCDQWGCFRWEPKRLKLSILPFDDVDIVQIFDALALRGFLKKYEVAGKWYGCIPSWAKHQRITRPEHPSGIPTPEGFVFEKPKRKALKPENIEAPASLNGTLQVMQPTIPVELERPVPKNVQPKNAEQPQHTVITTDNLDIQNASECHAVDVCYNPVLTKNRLQNNMIENQVNLVHTEAEQGRTAIGAEPKFVRIGSEHEYHTVRTECNFVHTECEHGCNTVCTEYNRVHTENVLGRTLCTGNREYGNGIGNREYGNKTIVAPEARRHSVFESEFVFKIFEHWQNKMGHPHAKLDPKRKVLIKNALSWGYSVDQICEAITGCSLTPHNRGENNQGQRYDGLSLILKNSDQIDRFIKNYHCPPKLLAQKMAETSTHD